MARPVEVCSNTLGIIVMFPMKSAIGGRSRQTNHPGTLCEGAKAMAVQYSRPDRTSEEL